MGGGSGYTFHSKIIIKVTFVDVRRDGKLQFLSNYGQIHDNTKPSARMGRKAYGSHRDSRVAEISFTIYGPGFFASDVMMADDRACSSNPEQF